MFIQESADREAMCAGEKAYIMVDTENPEQVGSWDQNMLFLAEIYGDFHCIDGGIEAFLKERDKAVLYVDSERYKAYNKELKETEVLYGNATEGYLLLSKGKTEGATK